MLDAAKFQAAKFRNHFGHNDFFLGSEGFFDEAVGVKFGSEAHGQHDGFCP